MYIGGQVSNNLLHACIQACKTSNRLDEEAAFAKLSLHALH